jgi:16S rRNA (guanine527-N7)-methyltransferase
VSELPVAPAVVEQTFGRETALVLSRFVDILATDAVTRGLIGPREVPRLWDRHVLNCAVVAPAFAANERVADVGSGAGLPGLVLAIVRPDLRLTLIESLERRVTFLTEVLDRLELANVQIVRSRAEEYRSTAEDARRFDAVTARAVAPLARLASWTLPLVRPGGHLIAIKGAGAVDEVTASSAAIRRLGGADVHVLSYGAGVVDPPATVVRITKR